MQTCHNLRRVLRPSQNDRKQQSWQIRSSQTARLQYSRCRSSRQATQASSNGQSPQRLHKERENEGDTGGEAEESHLEPEEDWTVPGGYQDSLSKNTKLGKAVDDACSELSHLGDLEKDSIKKANELLKKLGYKGDISASQRHQQEGEE